MFKFSLRLTKIQHHYSLINAFQWVFQIKPIVWLILKCKISRSHTISDQSLLLSTNVLNDTTPMYGAVEINSVHSYTYIFQI